MTAIEAFISDMDVFVTLPTGYGNNLIYAILVSPRLGLMQDRVQVFSSKGTSSVSISCNT